MNISLQPKNVFVILLCIILFLVLADIAALVSIYYFDHPNVYGLVPLFDLDVESNIPTFYSSITLLIASSLLAMITLLNKRAGTAYYSWLGLAIIFLFLSCDEIASIHEKIIEPISQATKGTGIFFFTWVIPYSVAVLLFVVAYFKFLMRLPKNIMYLFIASGTIYVSGALGLEFVGARHYELYGGDNPTYAIMYTFEELLEMFGIALFIYTLLTYISEQFDSLSITVKRS